MTACIWPIIVSSTSSLNGFILSSLHSPRCWVGSINLCFNRIDHCLKYVVSLALSLKGVLNTKYFLQTQAFPYLSPCTLPSKFTLLVLHQFLFLYVFRLADSIIVTLLIVTVNTRVVDCRKGQLKADGPHSQQWLQILLFFCELLSIGPPSKLVLCFQVVEYASISLGKMLFLLG